MELTDLTAYARRTWRLREERRWDEPAGFTVLSAPDSRRWVALLMRQWDTESGCWRECCDIRSGEGPRPAAPWLTAPLRMRGPRWVGVRFTRETEPEAVFRLLDQAVGALAERPPTPAPAVGGGVLDAPHVPTTDRPVGRHPLMPPPPPTTDRPVGGGVPDAPYVPTPDHPTGDGGCGLPRQCAHGLAMTDSEPFPAVGFLAERPPTPDRPVGGGVPDAPHVPTTDRPVGRHPLMPPPPTTGRPVGGGVPDAPYVPTTDRPVGRHPLMPPPTTDRPAERGFTPAEIVLEPLPGDPAGGAADTPLPRSGGLPKRLQALVPEALQILKQRFGSVWQRGEDRARDFYRQAVKLRDCEDDLPWSGEFVCYFPTYQDLNTRQLRGYFTWRAAARRGEYGPLPVSAAYLYLYELLNGIGAASPEDSLQKLRSFETGFLDAGFGDAGMRNNLRRWMPELAVVQGLPPETARQYADPALLETDAALAALRRPKEQEDGAVFAALCRLGGGRLADSPVVKADPARAAALFAAAWRLAAAYRREGKTLFTLCFGPKRTRLWQPLGNAVYYQEAPPGDRDYALDELRSYRCRRGRWQSVAYEADSFDRRLLRGFLHETELRLRAYLQAGRPLKPRPEDRWAGPYIDAAIEAERRARAEAARPRVEIDFAGLERIRRDAAATRDSLLVEEAAPEDGECGLPRQCAHWLAMTESEPFPAVGALTERPPTTDRPVGRHPLMPPPTTDHAAGGGVPDAPHVPTPDRPVGGGAPDAPHVPAPDLPLDPTQIAILRALLRGEDAKPALARARLTPALLADAVNEALYERFCDTVLLCENDALSVLEDYRDELTDLLGGVTHD